MDRLTGVVREAEARGERVRLQPGRPWPMGAHWDGQGVNFAVFSEHAQRIELCVFDEAGQREEARVTLPGRSGDVHHGYLPAGAPGLVYGLRAQGPWRPERGHRFNPNKLLLDPWAREIVGGFEWHDTLFGADREHPQSPDMRDDAPVALKARVVHDRFDWQDDRHPLTPLADTVLYELHVRGFTRGHSGVPEALRGTYAGLASDAALAHLRGLGVTAVSLLPVQQSVSEERLARLGLSNYWGYNTVGFFCPEPRYAAATHAAGARDEFRHMVRRLHAAGIEVILDIVFNHTAEGDAIGPTLSWRGLDNASWYRLPPEDKAGYENLSGCGNTVDIRHPRVLQFVMDVLRYWVQEMHVDGFRFDLAPVLGRGSGGFERDGPFFKAVAQDPLLSRVKMIAEPWDLGLGGYQLGNFPRGWLEWNDRFRDTVRAFWLGGDCTRGELAQRLCASSDLFQPRRRAPGESVNFVTAHDGFTLADLVSFDLRHNEANGEDNRDGHAHNLSWNCGWEGPTSDPAVTALRRRLQRALLATTLLAQGTPMLAAGSELGHSQGGNNNAYCQDNAISWLDWAHADPALAMFTAHVLELRRTLRPFGPAWYSGLTDARGQVDLAWLRRTGAPLNTEDWGSRISRVLGALIAPARPGAPRLLLLINGGDVEAPFVLPPGEWRAVLDTSFEDGRSGWARNGAERVPLAARSLTLLACPDLAPLT